MANGTLGGAMRAVGQLFEGGAAATLGDGQLLARFVERRDERAFEALVDRHGSMVWATCRAVLRDPHDAEDAFQGAFVALARRSRTIRQVDALGGWLHRVAYREAVRVGSEGARRRASERAAAEARSGARPDDPAAADLRAIVHAELDRLPEGYRQALVLCDLEGLTRGEAAHRLGWTEGSVRGRLDRGRELLRARLGRRGLGATTAGALVAGFGSEARAGVVVAGRAAEAVRAALASPGLAASGWTLGRVTVAGFALAGSFGLVAASGPMGRGGIGAPPMHQAPPMATSTRGPVAPDPAPAPKAEDRVAVAGRVVGPDGRGVVGARVYSRLDWREESPDGRVEPRAVAGPDGRFRFEIDRVVDEGAARQMLWGGGGRFLAVAEGFGPAWGDPAEGGGELTLKLAPDDLPIEGRVVDLEGRPVAGAVVRVVGIGEPKSGGNLDAWIAAARADREPWYRINNDLLRSAWFRGGDLGPKATSDADGRFRLVGVGRERIADLEIEGPTIRAYRSYALTRAMPDLSVRVFPLAEAAGGNPDFRIRDTFHGRSFTQAAAPTRPIVGTVRDARTGAPIGGVAVRSYKLADWPIYNTGLVQTTADDRGRFRLVGMPRGEGNQIAVLAPGGGAYLGRIVDLPEGPPGFDAQAVDVRLERGIPIRGRVIDRATGKPVRALVRFHTFKDNPALKGVTGLQWDLQPDRIEPDGSYRVVGIPGRGLLSAQAGEVGGFLHASNNRPEASAKLSMGTEPMFAPELIRGFAQLDLAEGTAEVVRDLTVDSGRDLLGRAVGPDGRAVQGCRFSDANLKEGDAWRTLEGGTFAIRVASSPDPEGDRAQAALFGPDPVPTRTLLFRDEARKLAGSILVRGDEPGPLVVPLAPWAGARGRLIDAEGRPRAGVELRVIAADAAEVPARVETDADGRFRLEGLIPGAPHWILEGSGDRTVADGLTPRAGDDLDLGEVRGARRP